MYFYSLALLLSTVLAGPCAPPSPWAESSATRTKSGGSWSLSADPGVQSSTFGDHTSTFETYPSLVSASDISSYGPTAPGHASSFQSFPSSIAAAETASYRSPAQGHVSGAWDYSSAPYTYSLRRTTQGRTSSPGSTASTTTSSSWISEETSATWSSTLLGSSSTSTQVSGLTYSTTSSVYSHSSISTIYSGASSSASSSTSTGYSSSESSSGASSSGTTSSATASSSTVSSSTASSSTVSSSTASSSTTSSSITSSSTTSSSTTSSSTTSGATATATLTNNNDGARFLLSIVIDGQAVDLVIDTGSSDTYVLAADFTPGADFVQIPDENFNVTYGDGTTAGGIIGTDTVIIAGVTVTDQVIGVAGGVSNITFGSSDGVGVVGLSFNDLTRAYAGTDTQADVTNIPYSSIMNTIFEVEQLTPPLFAIALNRDAASVNDYGGVFAIGGRPDFTDPTVNVTGPIVTTPMTNFNGSYTIAVQSVQYGDVTGQDPNAEFLVDSGTTVLRVPADNAAAFNKLYDPPAVLQDNGVYAVDCTATPPVLAFTIAGQVFTVNPIDLIQQDLDDPTGTCATGVQPASAASGNILGDVFLKNVLAIFDWGNEEIGFGAREFYATTP